MEYKIEFIDKNITPFGGLSLLNQMLEKIKLRELLFDLPLPKKGSNRGYEAVDNILSFMLSVWCGANKFSHTEILRNDSSLKKIFGINKIGCSSTFTRFFKKFDLGLNSKLSHRIYSWFFENLKFDNYTLDFDSSVLTRYGEQEGAKKGYNPKKPGRNSHHPLMAFVDDCRMVANFWLRPGNTSSANNFLAFIDDTLSKLGSKQVGLIRCDSGFYSDEIFTYLEKNTLNYIISAKLYTPIKRLIANIEKPWLKLDEGVEINESEYKANDWETARRLVIIRQKIAQRPKATGKQIALFGELIEHGEYRYSCLITNQTLPPAIIWRTYRGRANSENRIKELKYDFGFESFNMKEFYATEAALIFVMLAYNLISLFKHAVVKGDRQNLMSTLRYKFFNISAYMTKNGNSKTLNLALISKRRLWFIGLWDNARQFTLPVVY